MAASDIELLVVVSDRNKYVRFKPYIKEHSVTKEVWEILQAVGKYYDAYPTATVILWDEFQTYFTLLYLKGKAIKDRSVYDDIFAHIKSGLSSGTAGPIVEDVLKSFIIKDYATRMFNVAAEIVQGTSKQDINDINKLIEDCENELGSAVSLDDVFVGHSLSTTRAVVATKGYEWRLEELNKSVGPLRDGDFVILAARPETGKTTFLADQCVFMAQQLPPGKCLVWVNNEEESNKVMFRIIQAYFGVDVATLLDNEAYYQERWEKEMGDKIRVIDDRMDMDDMHKLNSLFVEVNPGMIVFDQLDNVGSVKNDREDLRLHSLYRWARKLSKKYGPVITASQAVPTMDGADNYIRADQLRGTRTDKQATADVIITIGRDEKDPALEYNRYIHVPKNKLFGGPRSDPKLKHGYFEVFIEPEIARYKGA